MRHNLLAARLWFSYILSAMTLRICTTSGPAFGLTQHPRQRLQLPELTMLSSLDVLITNVLGHVRNTIQRIGVLPWWTVECPSIPRNPHPHKQQLVTRWRPL